MRCNDCNRFVTLEQDSDPEVDLDVDMEGNISGTIRIANTCPECGTELTEYTFDVDIDASAEVNDYLKAHTDITDPILTLDEDFERIDARKPAMPGGRPVMHYGVRGKVTLRIDGQDDTICGCDFEELVAGRDMDEL